MYHICSFRDEVFVIPSLTIIREENWEKVADDFESQFFQLSENWEEAFSRINRGDSYFAQFFVEPPLELKDDYICGSGEIDWRHSLIKQKQEEWESLWGSLWGIF